ncbi:MAG: RDD family protein [Candidatus Thermoplasmatota archaeon]
MGRTGKYRSLDLKSKRSRVKANPLFRIFAYLIDAVIIRYAFQGIVFLLRTRGLISDIWSESIYFYLGQGLAPLRGGGITLEGMIFLNSLEDVVVHLLYSGLFLAYFIVLESGRIGGQTIGKKVFGIKVIDNSGPKISFKSSILRNSTKYLLRVPILCLIIFLVEILLLTFYTTRSGDLLARTDVISLSGKGVIDRLKSSG